MRIRLKGIARLLTAIDGPGDHPGMARKAAAGPMDAGSDVVATTRITISDWALLRVPNPLLFSPPCYAAEYCWGDLRVRGFHGSLFNRGGGGRVRASARRHGHESESAGGRVLWFAPRSHRPTAVAGGSCFRVGGDGFRNHWAVSFG